MYTQQLKNYPNQIRRRKKNERSKNATTSQIIIKTPTSYKVLLCMYYLPNLLLPHMWEQTFALLYTNNCSIEITLNTLIHNNLFDFLTSIITIFFLALRSSNAIKKI